jgi:hypothetical protein
VSGLWHAWISRKCIEVVERVADRRDTDSMWRSPADRLLIAFVLLDLVILVYTKDRDLELPQGRLPEGIHPRHLRLPH